MENESVDVVVLNYQKLVSRINKNILNYRKSLNSYYKKIKELAANFNFAVKDEKNLTLLNTYTTMYFCIKNMLDIEIRKFDILAQNANFKLSKNELSLHQVLFSDEEGKNIIGFINESIVIKRKKEHLAAYTIDGHFITTINEFDDIYCGNLTNIDKEVYKLGFVTANQEIFEPEIDQNDLFDIDEEEKCIYLKVNDSVNIKLNNKRHLAVYDALGLTKICDIPDNYDVKMKTDNYTYTLNR